MKFPAEKILEIAKLSGFDAPVIEKVLYLMRLLGALNSHPLLKGKWALKGGTALNLFAFPYPRLSVDIDLNYIGELDREKMLADRPTIESSAKEVFFRQGLTLKRMPTEHAGGKWRLIYSSFAGQPANLEVDINFMYRLPLWDIHHADSYPLGDFRAKNIPVVDLHELVAGKLSALLSREKARDLFDSHHVLNKANLNRDRLRIAFVVFGAMSRKDWRTVSPNDVHYDVEEMAKQLATTLPTSRIQDQDTLVAYGKNLVYECREALSIVLPFTDAERAFLDLLLEKGEIDASVLTSDTALRERIEAQPLLKWKALKVKRYRKGLS